jgi:hypothetical protein
MAWSLQLLLPILGTLGLIVLFMVLGFIFGVTGGRAPGWQARCTTCDRTRGAGDVGVIRVGKRSVGTVSRTIGRCSSCRGVRWIAVEPIPERAGSR